MQLGHRSVTTKQTTTPRRLLSTLAAIAALSMTMTTGCTPLGAICGAWLATPCIICFNENASAVVDQSLETATELPMTLSSSSSSSMPY